MVAALGNGALICRGAAIRTNYVSTLGASAQVDALFSQVKNHFLFGKQIVTARNLRQARKPRSHKRPIAPTMNPLLEFLAKRRPFRTGSD